MRSWFGLHRRAVAVVVALLAAPVADGSPVAAAVVPRCDASGADAEAIGAVRDAVASACPCEAAEGHRRHVRCATRVIDRAVADGELPKRCRTIVRRTAVRSTCGRGDAVTCCLELADGRRRARIRRDAAHCRPPAGGTACVGTYASLPDACDETGCAQHCGDGRIDAFLGEDCESPGVYPCGILCHTVAPGCGNGFVEPILGEQCEPPGTTPCSSECQWIHSCGNGVIERGETCDGQPGCSPSCTLEVSRCCSIPGACTSDVGRACFILGGTASFTACVDTGDLCEYPVPLPPFVTCPGACQDFAIAPLTVCCQQADGTCREASVTTNAELGSFGCRPPPPEVGPVDELILGTCGGDGLCVPAPPADLARPAPRTGRLHPPASAADVASPPGQAAAWSSANAAERSKTTSCRSGTSSQSALRPKKSPPA